MERLHIKLTPRLCTDADLRCFGPGVATLLERVDEHRSLRAAAASMGMAYSKAWRIIRTAEEGFGCKLLSSTVGGAGGGGAALTEEAQALLGAYLALCAEVDAYAQERFQARFQGFWKE